MKTRWMPYFLSISAIAASYWFVGNWIVSIHAFSSVGSPVWPSAGIAMAGLIIYGCSRWPGVFLGAFLLDYDHAHSWAYAAAGASGATLQAILGTWLLQRMGISRRLNHLQDAIGFVGISIVFASTLNGTISIAALSVLNQLGKASPWREWAAFCLGDGIGILMVAPVLMLVSQLFSQPPSQPWNREYAQRRIPVVVVEGLLWLMLLLTSSWGVFHQSLPIWLGQYPLEYLPVPLLIWAMLRFGQLPAVVGSGLIAAIATSGFVQGVGIFVDRAALTDQSAVWLLQTFIAVIGTTTLIVSTAVREQRTMQALLKKRDASLRNAQRIAQLGHWEYDLQTHQWTVSNELMQLLGLNDGRNDGLNNRRDEERNKEINEGQEKSRADDPSHASAISRSLILTRIVEADRERVEHAYNQAVQTHQPYAVQYRMTRPDGELRHMIEQVAIRDSCMMGVIQDVTERVQAEQALRDSEEKFSKAFGFSPDAMTISTLADGRFIDVNEKFLELSGYQHDEVIHKTVGELGLWVHEGDRHWLIEQLRQQRPVRNKQFEFRTKSGDNVFALVSAEVITIQSESYLLLVARDITEQKRADEQLRLSVERDRLLGTLALHIRQTLDLKQILNTTVHEVRQLLQASRVFIGRFDELGAGEVVAEAVGTEFSSLMGEHMREGLYHEVSHVFKHMPIVAIDDMEQLDQFPCLSFLQECVQRFHVKASLGVPILVNDKLYGILVAHSCDAPRHWTTFEKELLEKLAIQVAIAIQQGQLYAQVQELNTGLEHQVKERTQQLEDNMHELEELSQLKDVLLHAVSHDLLTTVKGNLMVLGNLQSQPQDPIHLQRHCLDMMVSAGERQLRKLNALQEAYIFKTQGVELERSLVKPYQIMQGAIADLAAFMADNQATVEVDCANEHAMVSADQPLLLRVFDHLLRNAVIHNPPGTNIRVQLHTSQQQWVCMVADDGTGIPERTRDRLFQLCLGTTENPKLTGISLGLYFCHQVIRAHDGQISISSVPDQGTAVTLTLPLHVERSAVSPVEEYAARS
ncbi:MAG: MASE1 domain-containing protein [Leptolyngbyaceae bacterium]|nr:MASE1 domain-containing protein [Leptolyngbyaceae bacterium]